MNNYEKELLDVEAKMVYIKHKIEWLKAFIESRINIKLTLTGHHCEEVEDRTIEIARENLEVFQKRLKKAEKKHGIRPFTQAQATAWSKTET